MPSVLPVQPLVPLLFGAVQCKRRGASGAKLGTVGDSTDGGRWGMNRTGRSRGKGSVRKIISSGHPWQRWSWPRGPRPALSSPWFLLFSPRTFSEFAFRPFSRLFLGSGCAWLCPMAMKITAHKTHTKHTHRHIQVSRSDSKAKHSIPTGSVVLLAIRAQRHRQPHRQLSAPLTTFYYLRYRQPTAMASQSG